MHTIVSGKFHGQMSIIEGFAFVNEETRQFGVRECTSGEGRVWYSAPDARNTRLLNQFGLQARPLVVNDFGDLVPVRAKSRNVSIGE